MLLLEPRDPAPPAEVLFPSSITAKHLLLGSNDITTQRNPPYQLTISFQTETYGQGDNRCQQELGKMLTKHSSLPELWKCQKNPTFKPAVFQ